MQTYGHRRRVHRGWARCCLHSRTGSPDDHEFWNSWPHASVTARHSTPTSRAGRRNRRRLPVLRHKSGTEVLTGGTGRRRRTRWCQSYHQYPTGVGRLGPRRVRPVRLVQTPSVRDRDTSRITRGDSTYRRTARRATTRRAGAPAPEPGRADRPRPGAGRLLDTRTRRTRQTEVTSRASSTTPRLTRC
ncbi:hypothetical protein HBB16_18480 [Pseudonocardia sp. MCCB 268]|nr:hypothetical protein [Pseudonocardia cytotoxica]